MSSLPISKVHLDVFEMARSVSFSIAFTFKK